MCKDKILLRQKVTPQRVTLPDGQSLLARYERVSRKNVPSNVTIRRNWTTGTRRQRKRKSQQGATLLGSVFSLGESIISSEALAKGLNIGSRAINCEIGKKVIGEEIKHLPELYKIGTKKIKNKSLKRL